MCRLIPFAVLLGTFASLVPWRFATADYRPEQAKNSKPRFTVSKETTYFTGPLDKDGYVDYVAALNERFREGVTTDNNAEVLLRKAVGPLASGDRLPEAYFKLLGIPALPQIGDYFTDLHSFLRSHLKGDDDQRAEESLALEDRTSQRPWNSTDFPLIAAWLKSNDAALALVLEATKRRHCFSPFVSARPTYKDRVSLIECLPPSSIRHRELAKGLSIRAMQRTREGKYDEAWQDLLACHRLARIAAQRQMLMDYLVCIAIDGIAEGGDVAFLEQAKLDSKQTAACLRDLQSLPAIPQLADIVDVGERCFFLDCTLNLNRNGYEWLFNFWPKLGLNSGFARAKVDPALPRAFEKIDFNPVLKRSNRIFDRVVGAMRLVGRDARIKETLLILDEIGDFDLARTKVTDFEKAFIGTGATPESGGKAIGDLLLGSSINAVTKIQGAADRRSQRNSNLLVAFALTAYQRDNGSYPKQLDDLAPKYLTNVPRDLFTGRDLAYQPSDKGFLLYSLGVNGRDDQGHGPLDDPPGDDLSIRIPLPPLRQN